MHFHSLNLNFYDANIEIHVYFISIYHSCFLSALCVLRFNSDICCTLGFSGGAVTIASSPCFKYEVNPSYTLTITLDDGTFSVAGSLIVDIIPDDLEPQWQNIPTEVQIPEDSTVGTEVFVLFANDSHPCDMVVYNMSTSGPFSLDQNSKFMYTSGTTISQVSFPNTFTSITNAYAY